MKKPGLCARFFLWCVRQAAIARRARSHNGSGPGRYLEPNTSPLWERVLPAILDLGQADISNQPPIPCGSGLCPRSWIWARQISRTKHQSPVGAGSTRDGAIRSSTKPQSTLPTAPDTELPSLAPAHPLPEPAPAHSPAGNWHCRLPAHAATITTHPPHRPAPPAPPHS